MSVPARTALYRGGDGFLYVLDDGEPVFCAWFALCDRPAEDIEMVPVLGSPGEERGVPICGRCGERNRQLGG